MLGCQWLREGNYRKQINVMADGCIVAELQLKILLASLERLAITEGNYPPDAPVATMPENL